MCLAYVDGVRLKYLPKIDQDIFDLEFVAELNIDEVLKVALTKPLKRVEWVEVDQISKKEKLKEELSTH